MGTTSEAVSGTAIVVLFSPATYMSPPARLKISGEKPASESAAKTAWQPVMTPSTNGRLYESLVQCGERSTTECPETCVMGSVIVEAGKSAEKTRGVHTPAVR